MNDNEHLNEHEDGVDSEMKDFFSTMEIGEQEEEASKTKLSSSPKSSKNVSNDSSLFKSDNQDSNPCMFPLPEESAIEDYEIFGFGTNKKVFFFIV